MLSKIRSAPERQDSWLPLDNAAKIFPAVSNRERTMVFRFTAELKKPVSYSRLQKALDETLIRMPYFNYRLRRGFFWYWLEPGTTGLSVLPDRGIPCRQFRYHFNQKDLVRVLVRENRISCEFYHALTDGTGGIEFLKCLLSNYAVSQGIDIPLSYYTQNDPDIRKEELEDAYNRYFNPKLPPPARLKKAYHLPFPFGINPKVRNLSAVLPADIVRARSKFHGATITEYLAAIYLWTLQEIYHQVRYWKYPRRRPVLRIQIPINLRKLFPTRTLRNFSLFVTPEIDMRLGHYDFGEIIRTIRNYLQHETEAKQLQKTIYRNVRNEKSLFIRIVPLFLKNRLLGYFYKKSGVHLYSGLITNLGRFELNENLAGLVSGFRFYPPPPDQSKISVAMVTFNNDMVLTFGNATTSRLFEKKFLNYLHTDGIPVKLLNP